MIAAGQLDRRIDLQSKGVTRNSIGEEVVTWSTVATVWAEDLPLRYSQFFAAAQLQNTVERVFVIRWRSGVTPDMRVLLDGQAYDIKGILPRGGRRGALELGCISGVHDGR